MIVWRLAKHFTNWDITLNITEVDVVYENLRKKYEYEEILSTLICDFLILVEKESL